MSDRPRPEHRPRSAAAVALAAGLAISLGPIALSAPQGAELIHGDYRLVQRGNRTFIHAADGTILRFSSFDIALNEFVRFIQPSADARVLARINSAEPTRIDGTLLANGSVYLTNPAGVIFGPGAVVNVGSLFAAAGQISNRDFARGVDRFTSLSGPVINHGAITADRVALLGAYAANHGSVRTRGGFAAIVSGGEVLVGEQLGSLYLRVEEADASAVTTAAAHDVLRPGASVAAGDEFALAAWSSGTIRAGEIHIEAAGGATAVSGSLRAAAEARGGDIRVLGESVTITDATINTSGSLGGGDIVIGGSASATPDLRPSAAVTVDARSTLRADATRAGDGGAITVASTGTTAFHGHASATTRAMHSTARSGSVEISGDGLVLDGTFNLRNRRGDFGSLVLDPTRLFIVPGSGTNTTSPELNHVFESFLEDNANGNIVLRANRSIGALDLFNGQAYSDGVLRIGGGRSLTLLTRNNAALGETRGGIDLRAIPLLHVTGNLIIETGSLAFTGNETGFAPAIGTIAMGRTIVDGPLARLDASRTGYVGFAGAFEAQRLDASALVNVVLAFPLSAERATLTAAGDVLIFDNAPVNVAGLLDVRAGGDIVFRRDVTAGRLDLQAGNALRFLAATTAERSFRGSADTIEIDTALVARDVRLSADTMITLFDGSSVASRFDDPDVFPGRSVRPRAIFDAPTIVLGSGGTAERSPQFITTAGGASFRGHTLIDADNLSVRNTVGGTLEFFGNVSPNRNGTSLTLESAQHARIAFDPARPGDLPTVLLPFLFGGDIGVDSGGADAGFQSVAFRSIAPGSPQPLISTIVMAALAGDDARNSRGLLRPGTGGRDARIVADSLDLGDNQRLLALGDLTLTGPNGGPAGRMTLGDINVVGADGFAGMLTVSTLDLTIAPRPAGSIESLDAEAMRAMGLDVSLLMDAGTEWVASNGFTFTHAAPGVEHDLRLFTSDGTSLGSSSLNGLPIEMWSQAPLTVDSALRSRDFPLLAGAIYPFDLTQLVPNGSTTLDEPSPDALATALPTDEADTDTARAELPTGDAALLRVELGLTPLPTPDDAVYLTGSLYIDAAPTAPAAQSLGNVTLIRVAGPRLEATLDALRTLTGRPTSDAPADTDSIARGQRALAAAYRDFPSDERPEAFAEWIKSHDPSAAVFVDDLRRTIRTVESLGLTELEQRLPLLTLARRRASPAAPVGDVERFYRALGFPANIVAQLERPAVSVSEAYVVSSR